MRQNKGGYILIYIVLLSAFLVLFFASFQGEIQKSLRSSWVLNESIGEDSLVRDNLDALVSNPTVSRTVDSTLSLVSLELSSIGFSGSVSQDVPAEYLVRSSGSTTPLSLTSSEGAPLLYRLIGYDVGGEASASVVSSWVVALGGTQSISRAISRDLHILYIESLGGFSRYRIDPGASVIIPPESHYRLVRDINGYERSEEVYTIHNFTGASVSGIDYTKLGMYLKIP